MTRAHPSAWRPALGAALVAEVVLGWRLVVRHPVPRAIPGPAVIEERITTIVVHPGWDARVDGFENVVMELRAGGAAEVRS